MSKLCINCKYFKAVGVNGFTCEHPKNLRVSLVTGERSHITSCNGQRTNNFPPEAYCGPEGKWYEDKGSPDKEIEVEIP